MQATSKITSLPFGNKSDIARTLTTKGAELKGSILFNAIAPMLSNMAQGHKTFAPVFAGTYKGNCPLCLAVAGLKGKAKLARDAAFAEFKSCPVVDQSGHDAMIEQVELCILTAIAPAPRATVERTDWKALAESLAAQLQACQIDLAECQLQLAIAQSAPAPAPAPAPALV